MSTTALGVKDFVIDISQIKKDIKQKKQQSKIQNEPIYEIVLQNNIDFVIHRKTSTTDKNFVFLISQGNFYIQDNKTKNVEMLSEQRIRAFFQSIYYDKFEKLDKVKWWNGSPEIMMDTMINIIRDKSTQKMYQHNIFVDKYKIESWKEPFENNIKLFKYCYDKCQESAVNKSSFDNILKLATTIEQEINFNNAKYFIDKFCESNVRMFLDEGRNWYRSNGEKINHKMFLGIINTYTLDFNRFIEYISFDLYSQGINEFSFDILKLYEDYLRMQISIYGKVKEKYPKHLKTEHDIISLKVSIYEKHKQDLMLLNVVDNFKHFIYRDKQYCIVLPESSMDIVDEGVNQSHCVASYVDKVAKNETLIVFMRNTKEPDKSLITVEVQNKTIKQAKGFANRCVTDEEMKFIKKWAKEKDLYIDL